LRTVAADLPLFLTAPLYRRWHLRWGATPVEIASTLPGDDLLPRAQLRCTRAITIDTPPETAWAEALYHRTTLNERVRG
jgi:hypothetical protein